MDRSTTTMVGMLAALGAVALGMVVLVRYARRGSIIELRFDEDGRDEIDVASDDSFPASDPPSYSRTTT